MPVAGVSLMNGKVFTGKPEFFDSEGLLSLPCMSGLVAQALDRGRQETAPF